MQSQINKRLAALASLLALSAASQPACAQTPRPFGVDDFLHLETLGQVLVDPTEHWLVIEKRDPYDTGERYDYDDFNAYALSRLLVVDLSAPGQPRPLLDPLGRGYVAGPFSPDGRSMVVFRLKDQVWTMGVVTMATGAVKWLGATPEYPAWGPTVLWRSNTELLSIVRPDHSLPLHLRVGGGAQARLPGLWELSALGQKPAVTAIGSGAWRDMRPQAVPNDLVSFNLKAGARAVLAKGEFNDMSLSASGRYVALVSLAGEIDPVGERSLRVYTASRRRRLTLVDLATGAVSEPCKGCDILTRLLAWSPADDRLLVYARDDRDLGWSHGRLIVVDPVTGARDLETPIKPTVLEPRDSPPMVRADWLGRDPIFYAQTATPPDRMDWYRIVGGEPINLTASLPSAPINILARKGENLWFASSGTIWKVEKDGQAKSSVTAAKPVTTSRPELSDRGQFRPAEGVTAMTLDQGDQTRLVELDASGRHASMALAPGADILGLVPYRRLAVVSASDDHGVQHLSLLSPAQAPLVLTTINAQLADLTFAQVRRLESHGAQGEATTSWIYLPSDWRAGRRLPLVVCPYPGEVHDAPPSSRSPGVLLLARICNVQILAGRGYAVLIPSLPDTISPPHEPAEGLTQAVLAIVDEAIAEGYADPDRLAVWGHSFGGLAAMTIATETNRFKAIIESSGPADLVSFYSALLPVSRVSPEEGLDQSGGWSEAGQAGLELPPWAAPDRYLRNSPLFAADRITTPLLMIHGDMDRSGSTQGEEMFAALHRQGKDAVLLSYWGEGHILTSPANIRDLYARVFAWLDHYLKAPAGPDRQAQTHPVGRTPARGRS